MKLNKTKIVTFTNLKIANTTLIFTMAQKQWNEFKVIIVGSNFDETWYYF